MSHNLSGGAIEQIMNGAAVDNPIFQVLGQKKIQGGAGSDRYRLLLSDGIHSHSSAMLATQLNEKVDSGEISQYAIVRLDKYLCNTIPPGRKVMIILEIEVITPGSDVGLKIGNPQAYKAGEGGSAGGGGAAAAPPAPTPAQQQVQNRMQQVNNRNIANGGAASGISSPASGNVMYNRTNNRPVGQASAPNTPGGTRVHPIDSLTPYQNRWTVRARVTQKSNIRTWSNSRGEGKLFSMTLVDKSGEIKATAFKDECDKYYDMVEVNKVYFFSRASLKTANKQYNTTNNDYEMTFNSETTVVPCDEEVDLPSVTYNFVQINQLSDHEAQSVIDVIGVVKDIGDLNTVTSRQSNREVKKRDLALVDQNRVQVRITLWGSDAEQFTTSPDNPNPIMAVKGCKLSDWNGRSLSAMGGSQIVMNPDIDEAHRLRGWFDSEGHSINFDEFRNEGSSAGGGYSTNWKTFSQVKNENLGQGEKGDYFTTKGSVIFMRKENCMYQACPQETCNKKLVDQANGLYRCEKCQKEYPNYKWRMILSANLVDFSDNQWVTCFQETAEIILNRSADELGRLKEEGENSPEFEQIFTDATFKNFIFKCRAKEETYNDERRLKVICVNATPIDYRDYNKKLIDNIEQMLQQ